MTWLTAANTFIWDSPLTDEILTRRLPQLAAWGFDAVELPLENPGDWTPDFARDLLADLGLASVVGSVFSPGRELAAASDEVIANTKSYVRSAIDVASAQGSALVIGPSYCSVGRTWRISTAERNIITRQLLAAYRELGDYSADHGVKLAIEPLNRYETSVFNTTQQLLEVIDAADHASIGLNLDTYHMNIEERSFGDPIRAAGDKLFHIQICGSDRGAPGGDLTQWDNVFDALADVKYDGLLGIESFTADNASIAVAASIWRPLAPSQDLLATEGLRFLTEQRRNYGSVS